MPGTDGASSRPMVHVDFRKWPDRRHWQFRGVHLGADAHGVWLGGRPGDAARRGDEPPTEFRHPWVKLIPAAAWWTAIWNASGELYVDITTPARWRDDRVTMIDLDLDVVRWPGGDVELLDEDEFERHRHLYGYPDQIVDAARTTAAAVVVALERGDEPFATVGPARLAAWALEVS